MTEGVPASSAGYEPRSEAGVKRIYAQSVTDSLRRRLKVALQTRDVEATIAAARDLRPLDLIDALDVLTLLAETRDERYDAWASRWLARVHAERGLQPEAVETARRLLRALPSQSEARAITVALRAYARPARTWS